MKYRTITVNEFLSKADLYAAGYIREGVTGHEPLSFFWGYLNRIEQENMMKIGRWGINTSGRIDTPFEDWELVYVQY